MVPSYQVVHSSYEIDTIGKLLSNANSMFFGISVEDFINFIDESGKTNLSHIIDSYIGNELTTSRGVPYIGLKLKCGVKLSIPKDKANYIASKIDGTFQVFSYSELAFKTKALSELENNKEYTKTRRPLTSYEQKGTIIDQFPNCKIYIFSRYYGSFIDVSKFIVRCNISVNKSGGNFSFALAPLMCKITSSGINTPSAIIQQGDYISIDDVYQLSDDPFSVGGQGITSDFSLIRNQLYFPLVIGLSDLVYIKFERLELEPNDYTDSFYLDRSYVEKFTYDLIGLIDGNTTSYGRQDNDIPIEVNFEGRDLSKVAIEEGSYFFPTQLAQKGIKTTNNSLRLPHTGELFYFSAQVYKSIEDVFKFVFNNLIDIKVLPDTYYRDTDKNKSITSLITLAIEKNVSGRRVIDSSLSIMSGSIINFLEKVCQEPFVQLIQDTYFNKYHYSVRVSPFTKNLITSYINGTYIDETGINVGATLITIDSASVIQESLSLNEQEIYTWFQLTPKGILPSLSEELIFTYMPALVLDEYVEVWGNKPLQLSYNYINYDYLDQIHNTQKLSSIEEQVYRDFQFMIESYITSPFSRSGTITTLGDRRIKVGNWIRYQPTNELFYVDGVSHSFVGGETIQRSTTIQVSRGLVEKFIEGVEIEGIGKVGYFEIVNTSLNLVYKQEIRKKAINTVNTQNIAVKQKINYVSQASREIKEHLKNTYENFRAQRYKDGQTIKGGHVIQNYSIGYGHQILPTEEAKYNATYSMSIKEADALFNKDILIRERIVREVFGSYLFQEEFDALTSIIYNTSSSTQGFRNKFSHFIANIKAYLLNRSESNAAGIRVIWQKTAVYMNVEGKPVFQPGLKTRRVSEVTRFLQSQGYNTTATMEQVSTTTTKYKEEKVTILDREKIFSNFKVNKEIFNFFLKNRQFYE